MGNGVGSPWGPERYSQPKSPTAATLINNPSQFAAFNTSPQATRATAAINSNTAQQQNLAGAKLASMGAGRSSGADRKMMDISAQGQNTAADVQRAMAQASFEDQLRQQAEANNFNIANAGLAQQQYKTDTGLYQAEQASRRNALQSAFGPLGGIANVFGTNY